MALFESEIENFISNGTFSQSFDSHNNIVLNASSSTFYGRYVKFNLHNIKYNSEKANSLYSVEFEEFVPVKSKKVDVKSTEELSTALKSTEEENATLKLELEQYINDSSKSNNISNDLAIKQVILELRKKLNEGRVDSDFSEEFPYSAIFKK